MEITASAKYLRISPRKLRLLTRGLGGLSPEKALARLKFQPQRGSEFLAKVLKQAVANAKNNFQINEGLTIKSLEIGEGPAFKRMDKSHGARFDRGIIKKRTAHVFLTLEAAGGLTKPVKMVKPVEEKAEKEEKEEKEKKVAEKKVEVKKAVSPQKRTVKKTVKKEA